jgi:prepilin-type N-terminal cleavage/methylation domain-containing protein
MKLQKPTTKASSSEQGFSLIEVLIAMVVMTIGLVAVLASLTTAITATQSAQEDLIARHKALDVMESIYTARNSQQVSFAQINNVSAGGIFVDGTLPLLCAGPDGIVGTADDAPCLTNGATGASCPNGGVDCMVLPGPDGVLGTGDDVTMSLANFTRTIAFNSVQLPGGGANSNMRAVTVTVSYTKAGWPARTYTVNGLITQYR